MDRLIQEIALFWDGHYPDVPCLDQRLDLLAFPGTPPSRLRLLIEGDASSLRIEPFCTTAGNQSQTLPESQYGIALDPKDGSICVDILDPSGPSVSGISLQCLNTPAIPLHIVGLQAQHDAPDVWTVFYNSLDRRTAFLAGLRQAFAGVPGQDLQDLLQFLSSLVEGQEKNALAVFEKSTALRQHQGALQSLVHRYQRQLNAHGIKRTFRYWSQAQKQAYLTGAQMLVGVLQPKFPDTCIGFGAVLGLERDADLIGHDDDIDILVALPVSQAAHLPRALELVGLHLQQNGFSIEGVFFAHLWVRTPQGERVDVFVGLIEEGETVSFYPSARHGLRYAQVFPAQMATLCGLGLPFPRQREQYLVQTYGVNWRSPDPAFAHPWDRLSYRDIDGPRRTPATWTRGEIARLAHGVSG